MPRLLEADAEFLTLNYDTLAPDKQAEAKDWLQRYKQQQADEGEPLFPSVVMRQVEQENSLRRMFEAPDKIDYDPGYTSADPLHDKMQHANMALLSARYQKEPAEVASRYDFLLNDYARQKLGASEDVDTAKFYALAQKDMQKVKLREDTQREGMSAALRGEDGVKALAAWQAKNADRAKDDAGLFMRGYQQAIEQDGEMLPIADRLLPLLEAQSTKKDGQAFDQAKAQELGGMIEQLAGMKKAQRKSVYRSIAARIEAAGYDQKGFWSQMLGELDKGLYRMEGTLGTQAGIAADVATAVAGAQTRIPDTFDGSSVSLPVLSDEEQQALLRQRDYRERIGNVQQEIMQIVSGELDPVKPVTGWMNETVETGLIKGPGAVAPFMAASALLGPYGAGLVFTADFAEQNRRELVQSGLDADQARKVGAMAAPLQAAVESLSNMVSLGKFPAVQAALSRFTRPVGGASLVGRYVQNSLISGATEFTEEQVQDNVVVPAMQELLGALEKDVPEVDWSFYKTRAANATPELAATLLPMALVFGGVMTAADARLSDRMTSNVDALTALNYSQAQATEIVQEKTPEARIAKAASLWRSRAGNKATLEEGAAKLAERLKALSGDAVAYQAELERRGVLPRVMHTAENDWLLTFNDGSTARFGTHDEASTARWTWAEDQLGRVHALTREALTSMERNMSTNRELGVEFKPDVRMVEAGQTTPDIQRRVEQGKVLGDIDPNEAFDTASMVDRATAEADGFLSSYQILGSSRNEFKDGVLRTTIKLWEGSNVLTLVEEKLEGDAKAIVASRGGRGWMLAALRNYEQESGDKLFREVPDDQLTDDDLVEAWSHLGQSYLVGRSSFGEPLQQNNMRRFSRLLMRAGLAGALNSESTFWQAVVNRAQKLGELKAAGKLNEDVVAELEKQLGIDSQVKHEQGAMQEAQQVRDEVAQQVDTSGYSEANPGPNGETFALAPLSMFITKAEREYAFGDGRYTHPVTLKNGTRLSGETFDFKWSEADKMPTFFGYTKNGDEITIQAQYVMPDMVATSRDGNKSANDLRDRLTMWHSKRLRAIPADASKVVQMPDGARLVGPTTFSIRAYHGTPHKVDKFTTAKIGTGEGAQAYGWGLYFAQNKGVAKSYQKNLTGVDSFIDLKSGDLIGQWDSRFKEVSSLRERLLSAGDKAEFDRLYETRMDGGNLYTVELLPDEGDFLDWDKPLSEQSEKVRAAFKAIGIEPDSGVSVYSIDKGGLPQWIVDDGKQMLRFTSERAAQEEARSISKTGATAYQNIKAMSDKDKSDALAKAGIPGIRYLDGGSRGAGDGTRNYVIFDENLVRILEENGKPVDTSAISGDTFSMASASGAAQNAEPSPGGLSEAIGVTGTFYRGENDGNGKIADNEPGGVHFSSARYYAAQYGQVREADLNLTKALDFRTLGDSFSKESLIVFLQKAGVDLNAKLQPWFSTKSILEHLSQLNTIEQGEIHQTVLDGAGHLIKKAGYDGYVFNELGSATEPSVVVFSESSIKPSTNSPVSFKSSRAADGTTSGYSEANPGPNGETFSIAPSALSVKPPKGVVANKTDALPSWTLPKSEGSVPKVLNSPKVRAEFYAKLDKAIEWLRADPSQITTAKGWVTFMRKAGVWGEIPMPPSGLADIIANPAKYVAKLNGGYHGEASLSDTQTSAKQGMDGTVEMRKLIGEGKAPAPFVVALHNMWGILSRMLSPIDQEGMWLRLIAHRPVLDAIQASIDGKFSLTVAQWKQVVQDARASSAVESGPIGNAATSNANDFYLMLSRLNGRWNDMADVYAAPNSREMGRRFWNIGAGKLGIKNKVQRFIGLTFGTPGVIMDRWKFVEFWLPTAMEGMQADQPSTYFDYSANTPSDPVGVYGVYGGIDSENEPLSLAMYEAFEVVLEESIAKSQELQDHLGEHANAGGMHWFGWNAIKNEAVGHSSLDLTKELIAMFGLDIDAEKVHNTVRNGIYYTEGSPSAGNTVKFVLERGKVRVERTTMAGGLQPGRAGRNTRRAGSRVAEGRTGTIEAIGETFSLRVTPAQDAEYMAAVEAGDMEKARRMVDEAAANAGYDRMLFHQTHKDTVPKIYESGFRLDILGARASDNEMPDGIFLKPDESNIKVGAANAQDIRQMRLFVRLQNPLIFNNRKELVQFVSAKNPAFSATQAEFTKTDKAIVSEVDRLEADALSKPAGKEQDDAWERYFNESDVIFEKGRRSLNEIAARARAISTAAVRANADGIIVYDDAGSFGRTTTTVVALDPNQIKSADPVTRDDAGNVIPLSQRFNPADDRITYSLRPGDFASRVEAMFSPFQRSPEARLVMARVAKDRALRLGNELIEKANVIRTIGSIDREARVRAALAEDKAVQDYLDGLTPAARQTLEWQPADLQDDPLVAAMLDFGKLMSKTTALQRGKLDLKMGDFDGAPWLPPSFYSKGAGIMPDQMAQAMFDAGLLPDAYTDTLWAELSKRIEATRKDKAAHREAVQAFKDAKKAARDAASKEADKWADNAKKQAGSGKAQRDRIKAWLRVLDGILAASPPEVRARVGGFVKMAGIATDEAALRYLEDRVAKLDKELEKWLKKDATGSINRLFKKAAADYTAGKKAKGKLGPDEHYLFQRAEAASEMDAAALRGELAKLDALADDESLSDDQRALAVLERGIVELVGDMKNADSGRLFTAFDELTRLYSQGVVAWKAKQTARREARQVVRDALKADAGKSGVLKERQAMEKAMTTLYGKAKSAWLSVSSFSEVLRYAFGSKSQQATELIDGEREASNAYEDEQQAIADELEAFFASMAGGKTLNGERLRFDMAQRTIKAGDVELSQFEAITALLMWRQEDGRRHMEGTFDEDGKRTSGWSYNQAWIDEVEKQLTPEGRRVMAWLAAKYGSEHGELNALYRERHGVNLPAHDNYAPLTVKPMTAKAGEMVDPVSGAAVSGSILTPGSLRTRSRMAIAEPEFRDALQTFVAHKKQMGYWKAYYDLATDVQAVLGNRELMNSVEAAAGKEAVVTLRKWMDVLAQGGVRDAAAGLAMNGMFQRMMNRAATVGLLGRVSTLLVQSTQLAAASVQMPVGAYLRRFGKLLAGQLDWKGAIQSDFIQRRIQSAPPIVRQAMENLGTATRPNLITRAVRNLGNLLSGADGLFTGGTYAILLDYHRETGRKLGLTGDDLEEHAHREAERATERVAQPTRTATRSLAELTATNPLAKVSFAYASEARQKIALLGWAAVNFKADPVRFGKAAFLVFGVGGVMSQVLKNIWKEAKGDDDEEKWSPERLVRGSVANALHGIPMVSEMMNEPGMFSSTAWAQASLDDLLKGEADMRDINTLLGTVGLFNDTAAGVAAMSNAGYDFAKIIEAAFSDASSK